jgi:hypothetical protein
MALCMGWLELGVVWCACIGFQWQLHAVHQRHPSKRSWLSYFDRLSDTDLALRNSSCSYLNNLAPYGWPAGMSRQQRLGACAVAVGQSPLIAPSPMQFLCIFMSGVGGLCQGSTDEEHT